MASFLDATMLRVFQRAAFDHRQHFVAVAHGTDKKDLSDYAVKVDEIEQELVAARYSRICAFQEVQKRIEAMEDEREKDLLTYRYIRGMKWEKICTEMKHSWQHIHRIHAKALKNFTM